MANARKRALAVYTVFGGDEDSTFSFWSKREAIDHARQAARDNPDSTQWVTRGTISPDLKGRRLVLAILNREGIFTSIEDVAEINGSQR